MSKYKPINGWTKAKMIEKIVEHVPKTEPCMDELGGCSYKNEAGKRCAVGAFLPNKFKGFNFKGGSPALIATYPELRNILPILSYGLRDLQGIHDGFADSNALHRTFMSKHDVDDPQAACVAWIEENVADD